jgi:hypothetical protein
VIRVQVGGETHVFPNLLDSTDGEEWDTVHIEVPVPAGADSLTIQAFSESIDGAPPCDVQDCGAPASMFWVASILTLDGYAALGDRVWEDLDGDGVQAGGEPGVADVEVRAFECGTDRLVATTRTDAQGYYEFDSLAPGAYYVQFELPLGRAFTAPYQGGDPALDSDADPDTGRTDCVSLAAGERDPDLDAGLLPLPECGACEGKVTELTLRYDGAHEAFIEVVQRVKGKRHHWSPSGVVFSGNVAPGETFSFVGMDKKGTLGTEIRIYVDGVLATKIHTSCSQPIGVGSVYGDFTVVAGASRNGGALCPIETPPPADCGPCEGKVTWLTLRYDGAAPAYVEVYQRVKGWKKHGRHGGKHGWSRGKHGGYAGKHGWHAKKHGWSGGEHGGYAGKHGRHAGKHHARRTEGKWCPKHGSKSSAYGLVFSGWVNPSETFTFSGIDKKGTLGTEIVVFVDHRPSVKIHTSCSQPIGVGSVYGDFTVVDGASRNGGAFCPL